MRGEEVVGSGERIDKIGENMSVDILNLASIEPLTTLPLIGVMFRKRVSGFDNLIFKR